MKNTQFTRVRALNQSPTRPDRSHQTAIKSEEPHSEDSMKMSVYSGILRVSFNPSWYAMTKDERDDYERKNVFPTIGEYVATGASVQPTRTIGDAEAECLFLIAFDDLKRYFTFIQDLRANPLMTQGHAVLKSQQVCVSETYFEDRE
ncbi:hypothetical protein [Rhodococcus sp. H29-C3]|uniref:hypothetical protein n=1 Tax=Rhodococcus sp. H29-C3 TaxID=3046307 RepID=UPI0024B9677F|nr:hypothetical protein [Rhodococcus sp. H29-C3]MDJ0362336.1 hypothetical protein [Rhodococcus sp. H29-C3]